MIIIGSDHYKDEILMTNNEEEKKYSNDTYPTRRAFDESERTNEE